MLRHEFELLSASCDGPDVPNVVSTNTISTTHPAEGVLVPFAQAIPPFVPLASGITGAGNSLTSAALGLSVVGLGLSALLRGYLLGVSARRVC